MLELRLIQKQDKSTGAFAESGPPLSQKGSDTYHMWSMIGTYNYVLYTNDTEFLSENWGGYKLAMDYIYGKVTYPSGLLNVTGTRDWARWQQGYNNTEAQMMYVKIFGSEPMLCKANIVQPLPHPANRSNTCLVGGRYDQLD